ncbi:uncharacterized protein LOC131294014 [Anopheles ziemanni]|uniref:uncharacterized protein LOC131294014 n=1 Tax=Anopheles ziemanni TaxID=345580 RepID=UPI00265F86D4|nr:uncharacterized protein LOC131294014 [Anopheles ziemanni]
MKCRLCFCLVDKQIGYASLVDPAFNDMVEYVFNFKILREKCIDGKPYSLPVLICLQCSRRVREFYNFGKMVETNQKNLSSERANRNDTSSVDGLLPYITPNHGPEADTANDKVEETLLMFAEVVDREFEMFSALEEKGVSKKIPSICNDKQEVLVGMSKMEKCIGVITTKLISALDKFPKQHNTRARRTSFEFSQITEEAQLIVLDEQLKEKEYFETFLDWINSHISLEETGFQRGISIQDYWFNKR